MKSGWAITLTRFRSDTKEPLTRASRTTNPYWYKCVWLLYYKKHNLLVYLLKLNEKKKRYFWIFVLFKKWYVGLLIIRHLERDVQYRPLCLCKLIQVVMESIPQTQHVFSQKSLQCLSDISEDRTLLFHSQLQWNIWIK